MNFEPLFGWQALSLKCNPLFYRGYHYPTYEVKIKKKILPFV